MDILTARKTIATLQRDVKAKRITEAEAHVRTVMVAKHCPAVMRVLLSDPARAELKDNKAYHAILKELGK